MKLSRIGKIKGHRVFLDFSWPPGLQPFAQFNLIYGWNGSGKTTLSALLRHLQTRSVVVEGEVEFEIDGAKVAGNDLSSAHLPPVRVFNRDFIASTIFADASQMDPIYYLGADSVEKQMQVEKLKKDLGKAETEVAGARTKKSSAEKALDDFCIMKARVIKEILISSRSTSYNNYDKRPFKIAIEKLNQTSTADALLPDDERQALRKRKDSQPKEVVQAFAIAMPDFEGLAVEVGTILQRSVVSQVLNELVADREVSAWVQQGMALHSGARKSVTCRFCNQSLPAVRLQELEAHFSDTFMSFQAELTELAERIESHREVLVGAQFLDQGRLYDHLGSELQSAVVETRRLLGEAAAFLKSLHEIVLRKRDTPFKIIALESLVNAGQRPDRTALVNAIDTVNAVFAKHNATTNDFNNQVEEACRLLEQSYVAEAFSEYCQLRNAVDAATTALHELANNSTNLKEVIAVIEREIVEHRRPAEQLNAELRSYLGHDELRLEVKEHGYTMTRGGQPANNLSEGEKTAIAFLYFLKSLQDRSFDLANGIIVIDDPVSSLDANALFSAFGYMKEQTKSAGQLFVLTHNFAFFRQVKNWFHHLPNQRKKNLELRPGRFYLLVARVKAGQRMATLAPIDPLLEQYESEYHYLFKRVHEEAHRNDGEVMLEEYYGLPNVARRFLEAFLAFRYPGVVGDLIKRMEKVDFDQSKKTRILRFLNTYSHSGRVADPEHDPSILAETKPVLLEVLELIKKCDAEHYRGMVSIVATEAAESDDQ